MSDSVVVVSGADGFIGHALVAHFENTGRKCRAMVRRRGDAQASKPGVHRVDDLATASEAELDALLTNARAIVHLAGRAHVNDETDPDPAAAYAAANVTATARLAYAAVLAGVERFVFTSTIKVNGEASVPGHPFKPDDAPDPCDDYARTKLAAERELFEICSSAAMAPIVLRLPLVYGPGVKGNFAALLDEVARATSLPLGAIRNHRSVLYVGNLVHAIDAALDAPSPPTGVHFVTDAESVSVPALVTAVGKALGNPVRLKAVPIRLLRFAGQITGRKALVDRLVGTLEADSRSFREATGWQPRQSLTEGLEATARWWKLRHSI
jgi:nucleoside-diphosphate-sugar epimerase